MAIRAQHTSPKNQGIGDYFNILRTEMICAPEEPVPRYEIWVGFYASEAARRAGANPLHQYRVAIPFSSLPTDPRVELYAYLKASDLFGTAEVTDVLDDNHNMELDALKQLKKDEIQRAKNNANKDYFTFQGVRFQGNDDAMLQIQTTTQGILARGGLREDWPGGWLAMDNTFFPIPDAATWFAFHEAIEQTGQANFDRAVALKARVDAATTTEEVDAIHWTMDLSEPAPEEGV